MPDPASPTPPREAWQHILLSQANQRPAWQLQDVYKLAFQAALGSEHAAPDETAARRWLEQEIAALVPGPDDPPIEPISPGGRLARLNLRPYLAAGGSPDALLNAFLRTAALWQGKREFLQQYLDWTIELVEIHELDFQPIEVQFFFQRLAEANFPPAHHSPLYRDRYHPAYRVILLDLLPSLP